MEKQRMLLPFVHGIDSSALSCALAFAQKADATLVLVSLIRLNGHKVRAEVIAQRQDFFELMTHKAARAGVAIECMSISTRRVASGIQLLAQEMACTGTLLFVREGKGVLLETEDVKHLLARNDQSVYLFRLAESRPLLSRVGCWVGRVLRGV